MMKYEKPILEELLGKATRIGEGADCQPGSSATGTCNSGVTATSWCTNGTSPLCVEPYIYANSCQSGTNPQDCETVV